MNDSLVQRQWNLECSAKEEALTRLRERTKRSEERGQGSVTIYGRKFISHGLRSITEEIAKKISAVSQGSATEYGESVAFVKDMEPAVLALITAKMVLDHTKLQWPRNTYQVLCNIIGRAVYDEYVLQEFQKKHPDIFYFIQQDQKQKRKGYFYAVCEYRARMKKLGCPIPKWTPKTKHKIGAWLFDRLITTTGWARTTLHQFGPKKRGLLVVATDEFMEARLALLEQAEQLAWCNWPMLCEPLPWSDSRRGGYLTEELRSTTRMIRTRRSGALLPELNGTPALAMLNTLQRVPYVVNRVVYEVALECQQTGISVGAFSQERPVEPPTKPDWDTASDDAKIQYRRERTRIEDYNHTLSQKNYRSDECLFVVRKILDDVFWIPWSFDYRGRVYPLVTSLSPQGTDFERALFLFAERGPVNEYWLAFQVATTYGLDKASMEKRQQWVKENHRLISLIADDPFTHRNDWAGVSEPWCFLAACIEYNECVIQRSRDWSSLPISVDATCSGLQHLSALTLDKSAAGLVNVVPTESPTDAYAVVANKAKDYLPKSVHPLLNRKVTKRTVMTVPYGVTLKSARDYIRQELPQELPEDVTLSEIVRAIYTKAIPAVIPGPIRAMGFIQKSVAQVIKESGSTKISWVTPSGFTVVQDLRKVQVERVKTTLLGKHVQSNLQYEVDEPDISHHKGASAPNLIHSLDATLLHLVFERESRPFTVIHDCVLMRSCDMDSINNRIREVFADLYGQPVLQQWADQIGASFDESVMINTLDINSSRCSPHLFC
jgi:DNA-directed RNA polymerase